MRFDHYSYMAENVAPYPCIKLYELSLQSPDAGSKQDTHAYKRGANIMSFCLYESENFVKFKARSVMTTQVPFNYRMCRLPTISTLAN